VRPVRATSAAEALARVDAERFAVILLDVQMPAPMASRSRASSRRVSGGRVVPILFVTAQERDRRRMTTATRLARSTTCSSRSTPTSSARRSRFLELYRMHAEDRDRRRRYSDRLVSSSEERYRQAAEAAEEARVALEGADRSKTEFLSRMSHELRTPLNAILGYIQILDLGILGAITPEQHTHLNRVRQSAVHLLHLVNEILDLVTLETARLRVVREVGHVGEVCEAALTLVRIEAALRNLAVAGLPAASRAAYIGDPDRVRQVLVHLLTNAVKFTRPAARDGELRDDGGAAGARSGTRTRRRRPWAYVRSRTRDRHRTRAARAHLRGVHAGRRRAHTRGGRHGAGPHDQPPARPRDGGRRHGPQCTGRGAAFTLWLRRRRRWMPRGRARPAGRPSPSARARDIARRGATRHRQRRSRRGRHRRLAPDDVLDHRRTRDGARSRDRADHACARRPAPGRLLAADRGAAERRSCAIT
jgi:signal transduction histidine kinase